MIHSFSRHTILRQRTAAPVHGQAVAIPGAWPQTIEHLADMGYDKEEINEKFRAIYEAAGLEYPEEEEEEES